MASTDRLCLRLAGRVGGQQDEIELQCHFEDVIAEECFDELIEVCDDVFGVLICSGEFVIETTCQDVVIDVIEVGVEVVVGTIEICG